MSNRGIAVNHMRASVVYLTEDDSLRVVKFVAKCGRRLAPSLLGVGAQTVTAAMEQGRMQRATYERLFANLAEHEAKAS